MRFVVHMPDYDPCSGGVRVMHYLPALLRAAGYQVATTSRCFFDPEITVAGGCTSGDIAIYPDIEAGNPLQAERVIRYMLYFAREHYRRAGGVGIPKSECVFVYMQDFFEDVADHWEGTLTPQDIFELPNIECPEWLYPEKKTVNNTIFYGKSHCKEAPEISYEPLPGPALWSNRWFLRYACIAALRRTDNLYTCDHYTVLEQEAQLCGCKVWRVHGKKDFRRQIWDAESRIMRPNQDVIMAAAFAKRAIDFFKLTA